MPTLADARRRLRALALRGDSVECPCCDGRFRRFVAAPWGTDRLCPRCGSRDRHRALWLWLRDRMRLEETRLRLLHFAPENALERRVRPLTDYVTADLNPGAAMVAADITRLPFPDDSFDAILCIHVLEHVDDDRAAVAELRRVLRPGGWAAVMVPIDLDRATTHEDPSVTSPEDRRREFWQHDHVRLYGRDLAGRLGLTPDPWIRGLGRGAHERFGLFPQEDIFLLTQPSQKAQSPSGDSLTQPS